MAPNKKRLLYVFIAVYIVAVIAFLAQAFFRTKGVGTVYNLTDQVVGAQLTAPLTVQSAQGKVLDEPLANALAGAGVTSVRVAGGGERFLHNAMGDRIEALTLPAGTTVTEGLWKQVLAPEAAYWSGREGQAPEVSVKGRGNIIGFSFGMGLAVLNFLGLLCLLYVFVWDPILGVLDKRSETIRRDIEDAEKQRVEARGLRSKYGELMQGAKREREELIASGQRDGESERQKIIERAREEAEKIIAQARDEIGSEAAKARTALRREVGALSAEIAAMILKRELRAEDHRDLVEEFIAGVDAGGNGDKAGDPR